MSGLTKEQYERLTPEMRIKYDKRLKEVKRNRRIFAGIIAFIVIGAVCAVLSMTVLFNIKTIDVKQTGKYYTAQEILSASGLNVGGNIIRTDFDSAEERIETMLPYIKTATINKSLSGAVTISVKDDTASMIFKVKNGYAIADSDGKVLEILSEEPENNKLMVLKTKNELNAKPGEFIGFADENEESLYNTICTALKKAEIYSKITGIDISSTADIKIEYQHRLRIKIGTVSDIDTKLQAAVKTISMEDETDPNGIAEVNVMTPKKVYVNPLETLEETTKPEKTEEETTSAEDEENTEDSENSEDAEASEEETTEADDTEDTEEETTEQENSESENSEDSTENEENYAE